MENKSIVITPPSRLSFNLKELWNYRELFYFFAWRDIKVKYKQTYLGVAWVVVQPLLLMLLFTLIFKRFSINTFGLRYEIFVLSGLLFWTFFNSAVSNASSSIIDQSNIIKKVYFPRLIIPLSSLLVAFFELLMMFLILLFFCVFYRQEILWQGFVFFTTSILLAFLSAFGVSIFLSALSVKYRDFRYITPFLLQLVFFSSQTVYSIHQIENIWVKSLLAINPLNASIELFRASFTNQFDTHIILIGIASIFTFIFIGLYYFKKTESYFADLS